MAFKTRVEDFEVLQEDTYDAVFVDIEECESTNPAFAGGYWKWTFEILRDGEAPLRFTANSSAKLTRGTKGGQWVAAIQGRLVESGEDFDFGTIQGKPCRLLLGIDDTERGEFNRIDKIMAPKPVPVVPVEAPQVPAPVAVPQRLDEAPFPSEAPAEDVSVF
jgi:hypothetical protein